MTADAFARTELRTPAFFDAAFLFVVFFLANVGFPLLLLANFKI